MAKYCGLDLLVIDVGVNVPIPEALYAPRHVPSMSARMSAARQDSPKRSSTAASQTAPKVSPRSRP